MCQIVRDVHAHGRIRRILLEVPVIEITSQLLLAVEVAGQETTEVESSLVIRITLEQALGFRQGLLETIRLLEYEGSCIPGRIRVRVQLERPVAHLERVLPLQALGILTAKLRHPRLLHEELEDLKEFLGCMFLHLIGGHDRGDLELFSGGTIHKLDTLDLPRLLGTRVSRAEHDLIIFLQGKLTGGDAREAFHFQVVLFEGVLDVVLIHRTVGEHVVDQVPQLIRQILAEVVVLVVQGLEVRNEHTPAAGYGLLGLKCRAAPQGQREEYGYTKTQRAASNHHPLLLHQFA